MDGCHSICRLGCGVSVGCPLDFIVKTTNISEIYTSTGTTIHVHSPLETWDERREVKSIHG